MESDRVLSTHLDSMADKIKDNTLKIGDDLYSDIERATLYSSCFIEKYNSDCQQLKSENERMYLAIKQIYKRKDAIIDMLIEYLKILLKDTDEREQKLIAKAILGVSVASEFATSRAVKMSVAYLLAKHIATSLNFSLSIRRNINKYSLIGLSALTFHGKVQKAAMSARHLHDICMTYVQNYTGLSMLCRLRCYTSYLKIVCLPTFPKIPMTKSTSQKQ